MPPSTNALFQLQFHLKFTAKTCNKNSIRCKKEEAAEKRKIKQAIEKGNVDCARVYAENAIRKKSESYNYLKLASRIDAVASRVNSAAQMAQLTRSMGLVVKNMETTLQSMDYMKIANLMGKFEQQFEDLDVTSEYIDTAIGQTSATITPEKDVNDLMLAIADEHGLEISHQLSVDNISMPQVNPPKESIELTLEQRLQALKLPNP